MPRGKKISIMCLFATGFICVMFACLRVIQVGVNTSKPINKGLPLDPTWLAIWGMVECSIGKLTEHVLYIPILIPLQLS